ncbi:geranylgeranyl transferase type 2 subunit alpha [Myriangium duriaei CBS 260.36]|uniref:Geranylgeranyl transferase type-2 subunit alpha n=1 Tax=Myriangium duriaei CBS 260.36 TaxID=1168546 RepID=A0A9P4J3S6_9PEZI|nr:geranylgeranyl transferase type 2 subunit alpha [Myriangium duriaei CBS 260.36]
MDNHGVARSARRQLTEAEKKRELKRIDKYRDLVAQVRERYRQKDYTVEALTLTSALLSENPEYYTIWNYRRLILQDVFTKELSAPPEPDEEQETGTEADKLQTEPNLNPAQKEISLLLKEDLQFVTSTQRINPKVYWMWNHRSWLLSKALEYLPTAVATRFWTEELGLVTKMLGWDNRNFHGWQYRRIVTDALEELRLRTLQSQVAQKTTTNEQLQAQASLAKQEFDYSDKMVRANFSNFSAWHHRLQQVHKQLDTEGADDNARRKAFEEELALAAELLWAATDPKDQSLWFYHQDLMATLDPAAEAKFRLIKSPSDEERRGYIDGQMEGIKEILEDNEDCKWIYQALLGLSELYEKVGGQPDKADMQDWLDRLEKLDPLRKGRWADLSTRLDL